MSAPWRETLPPAESMRRNMRHSRESFQCTFSAVACGCRGFPGDQRASGRPAPPGHRLRQRGRRHATPHIRPAAALHTTTHRPFRKLMLPGYGIYLIFQAMLHNVLLHELLALPGELSQMSLKSWPLVEVHLNRQVRCVVHSVAS